MKRIFFTFLTMLIVMAAYAKDIRELILTTNPPMQCQNCENRIQKGLRFEKGVKNIHTYLGEQRVVVEYDADKTTPEKIEEGFKKIGYQVKVIDPINESTGTQTSCNDCVSGCCGANVTPTDQNSNACCK